MTDWITKKEPKYITKKEPKYITKKESPEWITKKKPSYITKKKPYAGGGRALRGYGKAYMKGGKVK